MNQQYFFLIRVWLTIIVVLYNADMGLHLILLNTEKSPSQMTAIKIRKLPADDYDSEVRFEGQPISALYEPDPQKVIYGNVQQNTHPCHSFRLFDPAG